MNDQDGLKVSKTSVIPSPPYYPWSKVIHSCPTLLVASSDPSPYFLLQNILLEMLILLNSKLEVLLLYKSFHCSLQDNVVLEYFTKKIKLVFGMLYPTMTKGDGPGKALPTPDCTHCTYLKLQHVILVVDHL